MSWGRLFCISAAVFAACAALRIAYFHGFRVFDGTMWNAHSKERVILSVPELIVFLGSIALGIVSGLCALLSSAIWLLRIWKPSKR